MKSLQKFYNCLLTGLLAMLLIGSLGSSEVRGQPPTPSSDDRTLPFPADTVTVLRLDLDKFDIDQLAVWAGKLEITAGELIPVEQLTGWAKQHLDALKQSGTHELFVTLHTDSLLRGTPVVTAKTDNPIIFGGVMSSLWNSMFAHVPTKTLPHDQWLLFGPASTIDRFAAQKSRVIETRIKCFDLAKQGHTHDHQLIVSLPEELRGDLAAVWPDTSPQISPIEFSPKQAATDVVSIGLDWSFPPRAAVVATVQTSDSAAAVRISKQLESLYQKKSEWRGQLAVKVSDEVVEVTADPKWIDDVLIQSINFGYRNEMAAKELTNMKLVGLAMHNYYAAYANLPSNTDDGQGQPLQSWRVGLLPYLEQSALYQSIDRTKSWNHAANSTASQAAVPAFRSSGSAVPKTTLRMPVIDGSAWNPKAPVKKFNEIIDGTSNTIAFALAPADEAIDWMQPEVWLLDENNLVQSFFGDRDSVMVAAFDGSVIRLARKRMTEQKIRALLTHAGREVVEW